MKVFLRITRFPSYRQQKKFLHIVAKISSPLDLGKFYTKFFGNFYEWIRLNHS